jgi:Flp pilus assembly protein CpaB
MKPHSAQQRAFLAALFLLSTTLSVSSCSMIGSSHATRAAQPERSGIVVYAIKDIPEGDEISTEALEERELSYSKIPMDAITSASLANGRNAQYGIASGQIISQHDLAPKRAGHTVNVALSNAAYDQIRRVAADSGRTEIDLVSSWIEEKLNAESTNNE